MKHAHSRTVLGTLAGLALFFVTASAALAVGPNEKRQGRPNMDARSGNAVSDRTAVLAANPSAAVKALDGALGTQGLVELDGLTGTPRIVAKLDGFLTGPSSASPGQIALDFVQAHNDVFNVDLSGLQLARQYTDVNGITHIWWNQVTAGIPALGNGLKANVAKDGSLISVMGSPLSSLAGADSAPTLSAEAALAVTRRDHGAAIVPVSSKRERDARQTTEFNTGEKAALGIFATLKGNRLAWDMLVEPDDAHLYREVVDAATGAVLLRQSLVNYANGLYIPNYPEAAAGGQQVPIDMTAKGWLSASSKILFGPNGHAYADENANNVADQSEEINASDPSSKRNNWLWPLQEFSPNVTGCDTFVCTWDPFLPGSWARNENQSGTQLFVHINLFHDHLRDAPIGFTKEDGNFEAGGLIAPAFGTFPPGTTADDGVNGEALDGAKSANGNMPDGNHIDNANFGTPPDGARPRMQMFLWHTPFASSADDPFIAADGSNDVGIVYHEYTHGLSNRLVVDAQGFSTLGGIQAGAMGEAWSDWYAYDFLQKLGLQPDGPGADVRVGHYVSGGNDLIRFEPIDCKVGQAAGCPGGVATGTGGFTYGDYGRVFTAPEVHSDGEIWVQTLWDLRDALGSDTTEQIVTEGMRLSPNNPSFLDERNAILQADVAMNAGGHVATIWSVFAHRGMGFFAGTIDGDDTRPVEDFQLPPTGTPTGSLSGSVSDVDTAAPIGGAIVAFGGHTNGAGNYVATSAADGSYSIGSIFAGTYPKVSARAAGYDPVVLDTLTIAGATVRNWALRRDWAAASGGGSITAFNGPDYTGFGCGPGGAIDQSQGTGWGSDTDHDALVTGLATDKFIVIKLPVKVNVSEIAVNPSNTCGDPGSSSTRGFRLWTSADGTTFSKVSEGVFYAGNRNKMNTVPTAGALSGVQYVKFEVLNPQVPTDPTPGAACTNATNCGTNPDDDSGVAAHCGTGKDNGYGGCQFVDATEVAVYGTKTP
jgi:extracellular elastinolytic metalloproteinase